MRTVKIFIIYSVIMAIVYSGSFSFANGKMLPEKPVISKIKNPYIPVKVKDGIPTIGVFIKVKNNDIKELLSFGIKVKSKIKNKNLVTADIPLSKIENISKLESVLSIAPAYPVELHLNVSDGVVRGKYARDSFGYDGEGIIIGIVDTGIDIDHPDFKNSASDTRILYIWDQNNNSGSNPTGYNYGTEWTKQQIDNGTCTHQDVGGHGTHVAGIAAGNGRATGNGVPQYTYVGIAPKADIIVVDADLSNNNKITEAVEYIANKAVQLNKPWVVNLSLGSKYGPKDGTSPFEKSLQGIANNSIFGKGRIIVTSAGNEGYDPNNPQIQSKVSKYRKNKYHTSKNGNGSLNFESDDTYYWEATDNAFGEIWYSNSASYRISIKTPNDARILLSDGSWGNKLSSYSFGEGEGTGYPGQAYITEDGLIAIYNDLFDQSGSWADPFPFTPDKQIIFFIQDVNYDNNLYRVPDGTWTITMSNGSDRWDCYLIQSSFDIFFNDQTFENARIVTEPGNAYEIVTVGSINSKNSWQDWYNHTQPGYNNLFVQSGYPIGEISFFSCPGPTRDGRTKPDIYAPGAWIASSLTDDDNPTTTEKYLSEKDRKHINMTGTSMSAPHVTGAVALLLEQNDSYNIAEIKNIISQSANNGKLDIYAALDVNEDPTGVEDGIVVTGTTILNQNQSYNFDGTFYDHYPTGDYIVSQWSWELHAYLMTRKQKYLTQAPVLALTRLPGTAQFLI